MTPFDMISKNEKVMIENYIHNYTEKHEKRKVELRTVLREWDQSKASLFKDVFGGKLIVEKPFEIAVGVRELRAEIDALLFNEGQTGHIFYNLIANKPCRAMNSTTWNVFYSACRSYVLASNKMDLDYRTEETISLGGKEYKIQEGMKPMRVLALYAKYWECETEFEAFRIAHSQILNQKHIKGTLCLSIHPLDFMTMSDNTCGWSSCMSWKENGCYRAGTIEMMNSECVVVAYVRANRDMSMGDDMTWNSKKWRSLVVVRPDIIATVKNYPYYNAELNESVVRFLQELIPTTKWQPIEVSDEADEDNDYPHSIALWKGNIDFASGAMYNDFGFTCHHISVSDDFIYNQEICYSGTRTCISCGEDIDGYSEGDLCCDECIYDPDEPILHCCACGRIIRGNDRHIEHNGQIYCSWCFRERFMHDSFFTDPPRALPRHSENTSSRILVVPDHETVNKLIQNGYGARNICLSTYVLQLNITQEGINEYIKEGYLTEGAKIYNFGPANTNDYYIVVNDLTLKGALKFAYNCSSIAGLSLEITETLKRDFREVLK